MHVRNGCQADLEALLGLFELPLEGLFLRLGEGHAVGESQYEEITFRNAQQEILVGDFVNRVGL